MKFNNTDHHCDRNASWEEIEMVDDGLLAERRGVCQTCGRVVIEQYGFQRVQDAEQERS